jgi:hypothetical protein
MMILVLAGLTIAMWLNAQQSGSRLLLEPGQELV